MILASKLLRRCVFFGTPKRFLLDFIALSETMEVAMNRGGFSYLEAKEILCQLVMQATCPIEESLSLIAETAEKWEANHG